MAMNLDYTGSTQFGGDFSPSFVQDGYATGEYASMSIAPDGSIVASSTNGKTQDVGTLVLANFTTLQALKPVGGHAWAETSEAGQPIQGQAGLNSLATLQGQTVEEERVDCRKELANTHIAQNN